MTSRFPSTRDAAAARRAPAWRPAAWRRVAGSALLLGALTGCQGITAGPAQTQVRLIDASSSAAAVDVALGQGVLAYNLVPGTVTSYVTVAAGAYTVHADAAGSGVTLASAASAFAADSQYTVLVGDAAAGFRQTVLKDQSQPAPAGQVALRLLDQAERAGPVDVYLVASGSTLTGASPVLTGVTFGRNTGYFTVPAGTYSLVVLPMGTTPAANVASSYTGAAVTYPSGAATTLVLLNPATARAQGLQVVSAQDYDPAAAST